MLPARSALSILPRVSRLTARPVLARAYHEKVISHYERPRNVRSRHSFGFYVLFKLPSVYLIIWSGRRWARSPKMTLTLGRGL
jgi:hypothetical protein